MISTAICFAIALQASQANLNLPTDKILALPAGDTVVAVVNGKTITAEQVQKVMWDWTAHEVTQELISLVMVEDFALKQGVAVTDEEVANYLDSIIGDLRSQVPPGRTFEEELRAQGSSMSRLLLRARVELLARKVVLKDIDPPQMRKMSRLLIVSRSDSEADREAARLRAEAALGRLQQGESWDDVVRTMSDDQQARDQGGFIGWIMPKDLPEPVRVQVVELKMGEMTEIVESLGTFGIFRVEALGPPPAEDMPEVENQYLNRGLQQLFDRVRRESVTENRIVPPVRDDR